MKNKFFVSFLGETDVGLTFGNCEITSEITNFKEIMQLEKELKGIIEKRDKLKFKNLIIMGFNEIK